MLAPLFVCQHFKMERLDVQDQIELCCGEQSFDCLLFLEGAGSIIHAGQKFDFTAGDCYFIPAGWEHTGWRAHAWRWPPIFSKGANK